MSDTPLYDALLAHKNLNRASFHTPGHKNSNKVLPKDLFELDFTELPDTDNLFEANGAIRESEEKAAKLYGAKRTLYSAGGCTLCIQTMLKLAVPFGGKIIASRMIHKSAVNTLSLLHAEVKWIFPQFSEVDNCLGQVAVEDVEEALNEVPDAACVYITSPDYFGNIADIKGIAEVCKKHKTPLLVDNAHGAHLKFLSKDIHPITLGADLVADSAHKTLPVLTGCAMLHIANEAYLKPAKETMSIFASTSPSYPIMASLDIAISWLNKNAKKVYLRLEDEVAKIKNVAKSKGLIKEICNVDPTRLALHTTQFSFSGNESAEYFRKKGVEPEMSNSDMVVFIATPMNSDEDFGKLLNAIENLPQRKPATNDCISKNNSFEEYYCAPGVPALSVLEGITKFHLPTLNGYGIKD